MDLRSFKQKAAQRLQDSQYPPRKLVLIFAGVSLGFSLLVTLINYLLTRQIDGTGGLSGLGMRSILSTVQSVLQLVGLVLLPFWQYGFVAAGLGFARGQNPTPHTLLHGFRRWGRVLGLQLMQGLIMIMVATISMNIGTTIFVMTPLADDFNRILMPMFSQMEDMNQLLDAAFMETAMEAALPAVWLTLGVFVLIMVPLGYRFRMAEFVVMDEPPRGGLAALLISIRLMHRNCLQLVRLDLSYWWFYLLQGIILLLGYGDLLLQTLGIALPFSADTAYFVFYLLYLGGQLALYYFAKTPVQTTYSLFYDELRAHVTLPGQAKAAINPDPEAEQ